MRTMLVSSTLLLLLVGSSYGLPSNSADGNDTIDPNQTAPSTKDVITEKGPKANVVQEVGTNWTRELLIPLAKLLAIAIVFAALIYWLELSKYLKDAAWNERTFLAMCLILSFCAASFVSVGDETLRSLKDVVLVVVGFYFGSTRGSKVDSSNESPPDDALDAEPEELRKKEQG